ncbi:MAG: glycosyltransferase family 4 protein [Acetobacteraceae bacterium]|nr:glycosyltransferase family 4 protein [Acetobacteraceae bacterium]
MPAARPATLWIDVEGVFVHLTHWARPSGIQRLAFEAARALVEVAGTGRVRFVRHAAGGGFYEVSYREIAAAYAAAVAPAVRSDRSFKPATARRATAKAPDPAAGAPIWLRRLWRRGGGLLPGEVRMAMLDLLLHLWAAARAVPTLLRTAWTARWRAPPAEPDAAASAAAMAPGDVLFGISSVWEPAHMARAEAACGPHGLRYAILVYDMIAAVRPEFFMADVVHRYRDWARRMLPQCDLLLAISQATSRDIVAVARREGIALRAPVRVVPIGTGFPSVPEEAESAAAAVPAEPYVLFVSTIEVRKNHLLLLRVWRRLVEVMPAGTVPLLVFAGGIGWLVGDLMQQLANCDHLDGRIRVLESPSDAALAALYRGALFTVYPSHYEGWGLPVVESLAFGTPVLAARATSLPEAGGTLARYFAPDDVTDATAAIRALLDNPADLAAWRSQVRAGFQPVSWHRTAEAILAAIDAPPGAALDPGAVDAAARAG